MSRTTRTVLLCSILGAVVLTSSCKFATVGNLEQAATDAQEILTTLSKQRALAVAMVRDVKRNIPATDPAFATAEHDYFVARAEQDAFLTAVRTVAAAGTSD